MTFKWKLKLNGEERILSGETLTSLLDYLIGGNLFFAAIRCSIVKFLRNNTNWWEKQQRWWCGYHTIPSSKPFKEIHRCFPLIDSGVPDNLVLSSFALPISHFISNQVPCLFLERLRRTLKSLTDYSEERSCSSSSLNHLAGFPLISTPFH